MSTQVAVEKKKSSWKVWIITGLLLCGGLGGYKLWQIHVNQTEAAKVQEKATPRIQTITALGYLEPHDKIIKLSAPTSSGGTSRVEKVLVKEGDRVKGGQVVAILDSYDRLRVAVVEAEEQVKVAQSNLVVIKAGAKKGEIKAQQDEIARLEAQRQGDLQEQEATVARLQAERQNAQAEADRYNSLYKEGAVSASTRDAKVLTLAVAESSLKQAQAVIERTKKTRSPELKAAQATLNRIAEVRPVDIAAAQAQIDRYRAAVEQAKAQLDLASVHSPQDGVVLYIHTRPGEIISNDGIVEVGKTSEMTALLEVYETDIGKVRLGQSVKLFADSRPEALSGKVMEIGLKVKRQNVVNSDTSSNIDARVVEVRVKLDPASVQKVANLTNLQVTGEIQQ